MIIDIWVTEIPILMSAILKLAILTTSPVIRFWQYVLSEKAWKKSKNTDFKNPAGVLIGSFHIPNMYFCHPFDVSEPKVEPFCK